MQLYEVEVTVRKVVRFPEIEALSPESAESIAEAYIVDGEYGEPVSMEIESIEALPSEDDEGLRKAA